MLQACMAVEPHTSKTPEGGSNESTETVQPRWFREWFEISPKPVGGFSFLTAHQVLTIWWAYQTKRISKLAFRLFFVAVELRERRKGRKEAWFGNVSEIEGLLGGGVGRLRIRRAWEELQSLGLLTWSESEIRLVESPDQLRTDAIGDYLAMFKTAGKAVDRKRGRVPVPRRMVRAIASGRFAMGVVATVLGISLRCLRRKTLAGTPVCVSGGLCSAAWIAEVFRIGKRSVQDAFKTLGLDGEAWLSRLDTPHWVRQKHGARTVVNLRWGGNESETCVESVVEQTNDDGPRAESVAKPAYLNRSNSRVLAYPESNQELSSTKKLLKNQKPGGGRHSGVSIETDLEKKPPTMRDVLPADLAETARTLELFRDAVDRELVDDTQHRRLMFLALAERALRVGESNPCGLFRKLVTEGRWGYVTDRDEDAAHERLKRYFFGDLREREPKRPQPKAKPVRIELSDDARLVQAVQAVALQHRIPGEPFYVLKRERPEWTRERWGRAVAELEDARLRRLDFTCGER